MIDEIKEPKSIVPPPNNNPYIIAVVAMILIGIIGIIVIISLRPDVDFVIASAGVFGFITPTTLSLLAFMKSQETHLSVNSRLDEFIQNAKAISLAEGKEAGQKIANERTDTLAGKI